MVNSDLTLLCQTEIGDELLLDIVPDFPELCQLFLMGTRQFFRVWKGPVLAFLDARINGAVVIGFLLPERVIWALIL
jgi:hypothetical protein